MIINGGEHIHRWISIACQFLTVVCLCALTTERSRKQTSPIQFKTTPIRSSGEMWDVDQLHLSTNISDKSRQLTDRQILNVDWIEWIFSGLARGWAKPCAKAKNRNFGSCTKFRSQFCSTPGLSKLNTFVSSSVSQQLLKLPLLMWKLNPGYPV